MGWKGSSIPWTAESQPVEQVVKITHLQNAELVQAAKKAPAPGPKTNKKPKTLQQQVKEALARVQAFEDATDASKEDLDFLTSELVRDEVEKELEKGFEVKPRQQLLDQATNLALAQVKATCTVAKSLVENSPVESNKIGQKRKLESVGDKDGDTPIIAKLKGTRDPKIQESILEHIMRKKLKESEAVKEQGEGEELYNLDCNDKLYLLCPPKIPNSTLSQPSTSHPFTCSPPPLTTHDS